MPRLVLGLYGPTRYGSFSPFLNWMKIADPPIIARTEGGNLSGADIWTAGGYLDTATGEIVDPAPADLVSISAIFFGAPTYAGQVTVGADYEGEEWVAEWDGSATAEFFSAGTGASQSNDGSNKRLLTMGSSPGNASITLTLTDANDPPRNIRIYQARYATEVAAGDKFNPDWLAQIGGFRWHRLMGFQPTNGSIIESVDDLATESWHRWNGLTNSVGPKTGLPLSLIGDLVTETGVPPWVCIPHLADDALVEHMATTLKASVSRKVRWEYTNEPWNFGGDFTQSTWLQTEGAAIWPGDSVRHMKFYGRRVAQIREILDDVYEGDTSRYEVAINTQTVSTGITDAIIAGIDYWISENSSSLTRADIVQRLAVTGYYGDVISGKPITGVTKANPAVVTAPGHNRSNGDDIKIFMSAGMTELDDTFSEVVNKTTDTLELSGVDSSAFTTFSSGNNYLLPAAIFRLMDQSNSLFGSNPATYPTKYTYFNQQLAKSVKTGSCDFGFDTEVNVHSLRDTYWPAQKAKADANGWTLVQYEGNLHFTGDGYLSGFGGQAQFTEYLFQFGHCQENADVLAAMFQAWVTLVGDEASKFVEAGISSQFGAWAGIRFLPLVANEDTDDTDNPVWQATLRANAGKRTMTLT